MKPRLDLTGMKFNKLLVLEVQHKRNDHWFWKCRCDCGNEIVVEGGDLRNNRRTVCAKCTPNIRQKGGSTSDLTGKRCGKLLVLGPVEGDKTRWNCLCDCGKTVQMGDSRLRYRKPSSCGCLRSGKHNPLWVGVGDISNRQFKGYAYNANGRNITFDITIEYLWELFIKQNRRCALSGMPLAFKTKNKAGGTASIDRMNPLGGYTIDNVQWIHKDINNMKWDLDPKQFLKYCHLINTPMKHDHPDVSIQIQPHNHAFGGVGNMPRKMWKSIMKKARDRNLDFNITMKDAWDLYVFQGGYCSITGLPLYFKNIGSTASLDRIDSKLGYIFDNIQWIHKDINTKIKKHFDIDIVKKYTMMIENYQKGTYE